MVIFVTEHKVFLTGARYCWILMDFRAPYMCARFLRLERESPPHGRIIAGLSFHHKNRVSLVLSTATCTRAGARLEVVSKDLKACDATPDVRRNSERAAFESARMTRITSNATIHLTSTSNHPRRYVSEIPEADLIGECWN